MNPQHLDRLARELSLRPPQVAAAAELFDGGATVPFIARYRKEATGSLDEVALTAIRDGLARLEELDKRRAAILQSLEERGLLTDALKGKIEAAGTLAVLEDLYLPYRPKRRTRATIAREKGLEPLADLLFDHRRDARFDPVPAAAAFVDAEKGVADADAALAGARDILAERFAEDAEARARVRELFRKRGRIRTRVVKDKEAEGAKFRDYFDASEPVASAPSHRVLAMRRGEAEGILILRITAPEEEALALLRALWLPGRRSAGMADPAERRASAARGAKTEGDLFASAADHVDRALVDGYQRLLEPSLETELRLELKRRADEEAIRVFAQNLRELLLAPPLGRKRVLAIDPGFRTGCKVVCLDAQGAVVAHETVFPHTGGRRAEEAGTILLELLERHGSEAIAIGNGTAGRETEAWARAVLARAAEGTSGSARADAPGGSRAGASSPPDAPRRPPAAAGAGSGSSFGSAPGSGRPAVPIVMVSESGASIYSASEVAREEFPDFDLTVRGAVSIGRRLMDPLAELVKIDPKSIGVGQYQHDVDQPALRRSLDDEVVFCVNRVGVEVNTASRQLLAYVSGLGPTLAGNIIAYRNERGPFRSREELKAVPRLGPKAFEQAAGFLRIRDGAHPLDASAVHPESYPVVEAMARDLGCGIGDLLSDEALRRRIAPERYRTEQVGMPTLRDILDELARPGRDPRERFEAFAFADGVAALEDLKIGMKLPGVVTNVTAFGAFVDVGVHQDGLVHVSRLSDRFVRDPAAVVRVHQRVQVTVVDLDLPRRRIALSMRSDAGEEAARRLREVSG